MDIMANVQVHRSLLTRNELKACEAICSDLSKVQTSSLVELSEQIHVSKATILRFCQKLGYSGYSEFRYDVIREVNQHPEQKSSPAANHMERVENVYSSTIQLIHSTVKEESIRQLIASIRKCRRVYTAGEINSSLPAIQIRYSLLMFGIDPTLLVCGDDVKSVDLAVGRNDLMILYTVSGRSAIVEKARALHQLTGCRLAVITMNAKVMEEGWADQCIVLPSMSVSSKSLLENVPIFTVFNEILLYYLSLSEKKK